MVLNRLAHPGSLWWLQPDEPAVRPPRSGRACLSSTPDADDYNSHLVGHHAPQRSGFGIVSVLKEFAHLTSLWRVPPDEPAVWPPHTGQAPRCSVVNQYESDPVGHADRPGARFEPFQPFIKIPVDHFRYPFHSPPLPPGRLRGAPDRLHPQAHTDDSAVPG